MPRTTVRFFRADDGRAPVRELRVRRGNVQYRLLYFFSGRNVAVLACALQKEDEVPDVEIDRAIERKRLVESNPSRYLQ